MTELERLVRQIRVHYPVTLSLNEENNLVEMLNRKYSVTIRNTDSSADNTSDEQLHSDEELVSKIETLLLNLSTTMIDDYYGNEVIAISGKNKVAKEIVKLFKDHQNSNPRPTIQQMAKYSDRGETESKIAFKNSLRHQVGKLVTADQELDQIIENIVDFFIDTVNPVFRALNDSDEQSIIK